MRRKPIKHHNGKPVKDAARREFIGRQRGNGRCEGHGRSAQVLLGGQIYSPIMARFPDRRGAQAKRML